MSGVVGHMANSLVAGSVKETNKKKLNLDKAAKALELTSSPEYNEKLMETGEANYHQSLGRRNRLVGDIFDRLSTQYSTRREGVIPAARDLLTSFGWDRPLPGSRTGDIRLPDGKLKPLYQLLEEKGYREQVELNLGTGRFAYTSPRQQWAAEGNDFYGNVEGAAFTREVLKDLAPADTPSYFADAGAAYNELESRQTDVYGHEGGRAALGQAFRHKINTIVPDEDITKLVDAGSYDSKDVLKSAAVAMTDVPELRFMVPDAIRGTDVTMGQGGEVRGPSSDLVNLFNSEAMTQAYANGDKYTVNSLIRGTLRISSPANADILLGLYSRFSAAEGSPSGQDYEWKKMVAEYLPLSADPKDPATVIQLYNIIALHKGVTNGQVKLSK